MPDRQRAARQHRRATWAILLGVFVGTLPFWSDFGWKVIFPAIGTVLLIEGAAWVWDRWTNR